MYTKVTLHCTKYLLIRFLTAHHNFVAGRSEACFMSVHH